MYLQVFQNTGSNNAVFLPRNQFSISHSLTFCDHWNCQNTWQFNSAKTIFAFSCPPPLRRRAEPFVSCCRQYLVHQYTISPLPDLHLPGEIFTRKGVKSYASRMRVEQDLQNEIFLPTLGFEPGTFRLRSEGVTTELRWLVSFYIYVHRSCTSPSITFVCLRYKKGAN